VEQECPGVEAVDKPERVFEDPGIDLVVIAAPNTAHFTLAKRALLAGKHVVVDKPFVVHAAEAEELIRLAKERGRILSVFQNRRWDADFLTIRKLVDDGTLGEIYSYEAHFDRYRPKVQDRWREQDMEGSGMLYDLGAHLIDQAIVLFGLPDRVDADLDSQREGAKTVDYFHIRLGYGKRKVILRSGSIVMRPGPRFQIHGTKGSFVKYGIDPQEDAIKQGKSIRDPLWGRESEDQYGELTVEENGTTVTRKVESLPGHYASYYRMIVDAIRGHGEVPVRAEDAWNTGRIMEAAMQSSREQRTIPFG
jgi:scyllo-inositol 2-dehydrogenase (NADP+)